MSEHDEIMKALRAIRTTQIINYIVTALAFGMIIKLALSRP